MMQWFRRALALAGCLAMLPALAASFKVGDKVDAWNSAWYEATVLEVSAGSMAGYYRVHYDKFSSASDQWLKADNVRARKAAAPADTSAGPRLGRYIMLSYGASSQPLVLGRFELLSGGRYRYLDLAGKSLG